MEYMGGFGGPTGHWRIEDKRGRLIAFGLHEVEAKRRVHGTSNRARRW
jgi:hypothetical protein